MSLGIDVSEEIIVLVLQQLKKSEMELDCGISSVTVLRVG
jgi:hypothetical protein